jgi:hypothetical protein
MTTVPKELEATILASDRWDNESDYGDFGSDAEELEIIDHILAQVTSERTEDAPLKVTDIEDYEPPRGMRLPKTLGYENIHQDFPTQAQVDIEVLRDQETTSCK